ncbi:poly(A)-specific ribonuclease PARN-like isoform X1 [Mytilus californianus]|uniref:poly(A)-specific ribonuclease PARN-like isoform X1 n=1 Tax=Mytilus californianus TaxID=6549 RepID=UPI002245C70A|nr:poly(A)-specific ribonuclease PARN-like isoform X1 [Mytilus californianus]
MEVTRKNFKEVLPEVDKAIKECCFIAIDGEFSGLDAANHSHIAPFDTHEERYGKVKKSCSDFLMFQVGICTFKYNQKTERYEARPFNFYVFPRPHSRVAPDLRFLCQASSIDFLASQGFNFNKVFLEGISYLTPEQEGNLRDVLQQKHREVSLFSSPAFTTPGTDEQAGVTKGPIHIPDEQKEFIRKNCEFIQNFMDEPVKDTLNLPPSNGFQRKLLYQTIRQKFTGVHLETKTGEKKERYIVVTRVKSEDELKKKEKEKQAAEIAEIDDAVGFTQVIKMISQSGKLLLGHNMLLDIIHILHQFYYPLPDSYEDFKAMTHCAFPRIVDTKLMGSMNPFKEKIPSTALGDLQKFLEFPPFCKPEVDLAEGFSSYNTPDQHHEAGFDAYLTGLCYISMTNYLGSLQKNASGRVSPTSSSLDPYVNKLFLMRMSDAPYIDLTGPDLKLKREHVFNINFPKEWKNEDLNQLFSPFGNIQISWLNDTSAYVSLYRKEEAKNVMKTLCKDNTVYQIRGYNDHKSGNSGNVRKRPMSAPDCLPPSKKQKSLNVEESSSESAAPFVSRSITPPLSEIIGPEVPSYADALKKSVKNGQSNKSKNKEVGDDGDVKMFEEPENWG